MTANSRKFVTDLFTTASEHQSFTSLEEAAIELFANHDLPDSLTECESPCICFDVTGELAKLIADLRDPSDRDSKWSWQLNGWLERHGAIETVRRVA